MAAGEGDGFRGREGGAGALGAGGAGAVLKIVSVGITGVLGASRGRIVAILAVLDGTRSGAVAAAGEELLKGLWLSHPPRLGERVDAFLGDGAGGDGGGRVEAGGAVRGVVGGHGGEGGLGEGGKTAVGWVLGRIRWGLVGAGVTGPPGHHGCLVLVLVAGGGTGVKGAIVVEH